MRDAILISTTLTAFLACCVYMAVSWRRAYPPEPPPHTVRRADLDRLTVAIQGVAAGMRELEPAARKAGEAFREFGQAMTRAMQQSKSVGFRQSPYEPKRRK